MGVPGSANFLLAGSQGYRIERSLRFNSADSAYLNRTPASAGNRRTFTWSGWVKRSKFGDENKTFTAGSSGIITYLQFQDNVTDGLTFARYTGTHTFRLSTTQVFRDSSAWYHITLAVDTTQATDTNRVKIYVNGTQITVFTTATYPAQNLDLEINNTNDHRIGSGSVGFSSSGYLDGYLTEINFIDGQALTPSSFGETDTITGVWKPKKYAGTYGTNGFYLNFSDNSGTTSTTLGKDSSGNGNNWTPNNFSVTAGSGNDSMIDTPTPYADGGNGRGNYCTWNPLSSSIFGSNFDGNLKFDVPNARSCLGNFAMSSGKWYCEISMGQIGAVVGIAAATLSFTAAGANDAFGTINGWGYVSTGNKRTNNSDSAYGASWVANDIIGVAYDADAGSLTFYKNGVSQGAAFTGITVPVVFAAYGGAGTTTGTFATLNAGQRPFAYTPPSGFVALNTQNLPEPSIKKPNQYFNAVTYTGSSSSVSVTGVGFQPDFIWTKARSTTFNHGVFDSVRGFGSGATKILFTNNTNAEQTQSNILSVNSDGFTTGTTSVGETNNSGDTYVAWNWKESATPGFDIVTYTGNGTARTIAHSLGVAPSWMVVKRRDAAEDWGVYHVSMGNGNYMYLNGTQGSTSGSVWNNTTPTSSVFSVGTSTVVNANTGTYVAYLWSEVAGFSKFGSYRGNGSSDGPFVFCGFRPRWILIKTSSTTGNWHVMDAVRGTSNAITARLFPNLNNAEQTGSTDIDFLSNGFKIRNNISGFNDNGVTHVYAAFSESAFKYSLAR